ncbi:MAG TPA: hypothetical protein VI612_00995 [Candidatus Nanoarchaeia archaeon]|nr:hypothetical protein [Candidatus Nanoarchaeia archaeon]
MTMLFQAATLQINPIQLFRQNEELGNLIILTLVFGLFFRFLIHKAFLRHGGGFHKETKTLNALAFALALAVSFGILTGTKFSFAAILTEGILQLFFGSLMGIFAYMIMSGTQWGKKEDSPVIAISVLVAVIFTAIFQAKTGIPGQITGWIFWIATLFFVGWGVQRFFAKKTAGAGDASVIERAKAALVASNQRIAELERHLASAATASQTENRDRQNLGPGLDRMEALLKQLLKALQPVAAAGAVVAGAAMPAGAAVPAKVAASAVQAVSQKARDISENYKKMADAFNILIDQLHASDADVASISDAVKALKSSIEALKKNVEDKHLPIQVSGEVNSLIEEAESLVAWVEAAQSAAQQEDAALRPAAEHEADSLRRDAADVAAIVEDLPVLPVVEENLPVLPTIESVNRALINEQRLRQIMEKKKLEKPVIDELLAGFQNTTAHRKKVFAEIKKKAEEIAERKAAIEKRVAAEEMARKIEAGELVKISDELRQVKESASIILTQLGALQKFDDKLLWDWYSRSFESVYSGLVKSVVSLRQVQGDLENFVHLAKDMKAPAEQIKPAEKALTLIKILIAVVTAFDLEEIDGLKREGNNEAAIKRLKRMRKIDIRKVRTMAIDLGVEVKIEV